MSLGTWPGYDLWQSTLSTTGPTAAPTMAEAGPYWALPPLDLQRIKLDVVVAGRARRLVGWEECGLRRAEDI